MTAHVAEPGYGNNLSPPSCHPRHRFMPGNDGREVESPARKLRVMKPLTLLLVAGLVGFVLQGIRLVLSRFLHILGGIFASLLRRLRLIFEAVGTVFDCLLARFFFPGLARDASETKGGSE